MGAALSLVRWVAAALVRAVVWPLCAAAESTAFLGTEALATVALATAVGER